VKDFTAPMNMSTGAPAFGAIEIAVHNAASAQMFQHYGVPMDFTTAYPNSKIPDYQCAVEKAMRVFTAGISGGNTLLFHGSVYGELTHHPLQAVLDDDMAGMVQRFMDGVTVNTDSLALDLIEKVGPVPGHFLTAQHTRQWWKKEQFLPQSADRTTYPEWLTSGKKTCLDHARDRMEQILASHKPQPLTASQEEEVERVLEEARAHYRRVGLISEHEMRQYRNSMKSPNYPFE
ncbi:MAG TPA: hypothetical protein ENL12_01275, partial [Dehalococcoidia bacterium]|nr:hypothetical protein [Dehalococcoidia bacterium]